MNNARNIFKPVILISLSLLLHSCNERLTSTLFKHRYPHQQYEQHLKDAGLSSSALFRQWMDASERSLQEPLAISIPYLEKAYFSADRPSATGFIFDARKGEQLQVALQHHALDSAHLFMDLFEAAQDTLQHGVHLHSADTGDTALIYTIRNTGKYILRLQPELLSDISYEVTITAEPSLANPVAEAAKQHIGSFFGDGRDAGSRKHEGVDIFAKRLTPAVAAAKGTVSRVGLNNLGGKVVFLKPDGRAINLYYAHLDSQLVSAGQSVSAGDTLGLIGNTGNARLTPPHLHFGIYTPEGAVDPLPFLKPGKSNPPNIASDTSRIGDMVRATTGDHTVGQNTPVRIEAAAQNGYRVVLPDKRNAFVSRQGVADLSKPLKSITLNQSKVLYAVPHLNAARTADYPSGTTLGVIGDYQDFYLTKKGSITGWILK